jgi:hypothetical protein
MRQLLQVRKQPELERQWKNNFLMKTWSRGWSTIDGRINSVIEILFETEAASTALSITC